MANLQGYELTVTGRALLAKAGTGACTLNFTKVKLGADETSLNDLINKTDLVGTNIKQIDIVGSKANGATFTIIATVTNSGMQNNFLIRQVGIFAKGVAATNPGTGVTPEDISETLFAVAYDTQPDIIPAESITPYTRQFNANMTVTNVEQCYVTLTPAGVVTVQVLNNHNDNSEAHGNLIKRIFGSANATTDSVKQEIEDWAKKVCLPLSGGTLTGDLNASGHNITANNFIGMASRAGDVTGGYYKPEEAFPTNDFRTKIFGTSADDWSLHLIPFRTKMPDGDSNHAGFAFAAGDTQGFIQASYIGPKVVIGAGNQDNINWTKQLAFKDSSILNNIEINNNNLKITKGDGSTNELTIPYSSKTGDVIGSFGEGTTTFPKTSFRSSMFGSSQGGGHIKSFNCKTPTTAESSPNHSGIAFGARDTHGFLQLKYDVPTAWIGAGNADKINWTKQLAFKDDIPSAVNTMMVKPMMMISESDIVGTGWTKNIDGVITQIMEVDLTEQEEVDIQFPISFPEKCLFLDVEIINIEKDTSINCNFHTVEKTLDGAKLLKVGTGSPKKIIVKVIGI